MATKTCTKCNVDKSVEEFTPRKNRAPGAREAMCKQCVRVKSKEWYRANRERVLERTSAYQKSNIERSRAYSRKYHEANREKRRTYAEEYRASDPDRIREQRERARLRNPGKNREDAHRRRAMLAGVEFDPTVKVQSLRVRDGDFCCYCSRVMNFDGDQYAPNRATLEHITAITQGGGHTFENAAISCRQCNVSKNARTFLWEWTPRVFADDLKGG